MTGIHGGTREGRYLANTDLVTISQHGSSLSRVAADNYG
jgi:hypothetical protein